MIEMKRCPYCSSQSLKSTVAVLDGWRIWLCEKCKHFTAIPLEDRSAEGGRPTLNSRSVNS